MTTVLARPALLALAGVLVGAPAVGEPPGANADWPRLWGPSGTGVSAESLGIAGTPSLVELWRRPIGSGYSGIAVHGRRGYTAASDGTRDVVIAFELSTGTDVWRAPLGPTYRGHDGSGDGPTSTPSVGGDRVFIVGPRGRLVALSATSGAVIWSHDLAGEYGAVVPAWGFATSPLIVGDRVIVQVGGPRHGLAAFDAATGSLRWSSSHAMGTGYSSPVLAELAGALQVVVNAKDLLYAVRPGDGSLLWSRPTGSGREPSRPPQILAGNRVLLQNLDESRLFEVEPSSTGPRVRRLWISPRLRYSYSPTFLHEGFLYGFGSEYLLCVDPTSAEVVWREKVGSGSAVLADGHLVVLGDQSGLLRVVQLSPSGYRERLQRRVFGGASWTTPSIAGGRLYLRNVEEMVALELRGSAEVLARQGGAGLPSPRHGSLVQTGTGDRGGSAIGGADAVSSRERSLLRTQPDDGLHLGAL